MSSHDDVASNPWPGYVDALSTIIMVFIFLVILLGIVITALSQNIAREMAEAKSDAQQAREELRQHKEGKPDGAKSAGPSAGTLSGAAQQQAAAKSSVAADVQTGKEQQQQQRAAVGDGDLRSRLREALVSEIPIKGSDKMAVLSQKVDAQKSIAVVDGDKPVKTLDGSRVDSSEAALTLVFDNGVRISEATSAEIRTHLAAHPDLAERAKMEIWAFANPGGGSISEARRTAYYRALMVRNELLGHGFSSDRIALRVSVSQRDEDRARVKVFVK